MSGGGATFSVGQFGSDSFCVKHQLETIWHLYFSVLCIIKQFVKNDLPNSNESKNQQSLDIRFATRPHLRRRLLMIADMIDQAVAEGCSAHEAEARAIEQIRKLGQEVMTDWAEKFEQSVRDQAQAENPKLTNYLKKNAEMALDLWRDLRGRTTLAVRPTRSASAAVL